MSNGSMTTDPVDPGDVRTFKMEYAAMLSALGSNIVITDSAWEVPDDITVIDEDTADNETSTTIKLDFANATKGRNYTLYNSIEITGGDKRRRAMILPVRDAATFSPASTVKETLDAIRAAIAGVATRAQRTRTIGNTTIEFMSMQDLIIAETRWQQLYNAERRAERLRNGEPFFKNVQTRFVPPT